MNQILTIPFRLITRKWKGKEKVYYNMPDKNTFDICRRDIKEIFDKNGLKQTDQNISLDIKYYMKGQKLITIEELNAFIMGILFDFKYLKKAGQIRRLYSEIIQGNEDWKTVVSINIISRL